MAHLVVSHKNVGYFNSYILRRITNNQNFIGCITGDTGSGKSYSALREGEVLDKNFTIDNVCFTPEQFMDLINGKTKRLNKGAVIIYDEIQVTMSALEFQSLQAKLVNYVLQTFRHRNFILIMTSPFFDFINKSARKMFHARLETIAIDFNEKVCRLKPFLIQVNQKTSNTYEKYLRVASPIHGVMPVTVLKCRKPSEELIAQYEEKKNQFTSDLNKQITQDLKRFKQQDGIKKELTMQQKDIIMNLKQRKTIWDIAQDLNVTKKVIYEQLKLIKKKGVKITPKKEGNRVIYYEILGFDGF